MEIQIGVDAIDSFVIDMDVLLLQHGMDTSVAEGRIIQSYVFYLILERVLDRIRIQDTINS